MLDITDWRHPFVIDGKQVPLVKPWYSEWHPWRWSVDLPVLRQALGTLEGRSLLDVGCQDGWYSFQAAEAGAEALGIDLRDEAIRRANLIRDHHRLDSPRFLQGNIEDAASVHGTFDIVLNYGLLYHLADPIGVLRRLGAATRRIMAVQTFIHAMDRAPVLHLLREGTGLAGKGATELITTPTQRAIVLMLKEAGFDHVYRNMPGDYRRRTAGTVGGNGEWQWTFFYGVKGDPLPDMPGVRQLGENDAPLNHFGPLSQLAGLANARLRRWRGRDTIGGF
jgi:SAM-dependent methyltransferase